jgi:hypothetical protein
MTQLIISDLTLQASLTELTVTEQQPVNGGGRTDLTAILNANVNASNSIINGGINIVQNVS